MEPISYFYAYCIVFAILVFAFAAFQFMWKAQPVNAISEFTRQR